MRLNKFFFYRYKQLTKRKKNWIYSITANSLFLFKPLMLLILLMFKSTDIYEVVYPIISNYGISLNLIGWVFLITGIFRNTSISSIKYYRKYIKPNRIWVHRMFSDDDESVYYEYLPLPKEYYYLDKEKNSIKINPIDIFNNIDISSKDNYIKLSEKWLDMYEKFPYEIQDSVDSTCKGLFINHTKYPLQYTITENIFLINTRDHNIDEILKESA